MADKEPREEFDTGLRKIKHEIKSRLMPHGLFGTVATNDVSSSDPIPPGSTIEIAVKGRTVGRAFDRRQIEACHLRVGGEVLVGIIAMIDELSA